MDKYKYVVSCVSVYLQIKDKWSASGLWFTDKHWTSEEHHYENLSASSTDVAQAQSSVIPQAALGA